MRSSSRSSRSIRRPPARRVSCPRSRTATRSRSRYPRASIFLHPFTTVTGAYESVDEFAAEAIRIERRLVQDILTAAPATRVQFDFPLYPYLVDPAWVERFEAARSSRRRPGRRCGRRRRRGARGHPRRRDGGAPHLPRELPLVVDVRGLARAGRRARVRRAPVRRVPGRVGRPRPRRRVRAGAVPEEGFHDGHGGRLDQDAGARGGGRPRADDGGRRRSSPAAWNGSRSARSAGSRA